MYNEIRNLCSQTLSFLLNKNHSRESEICFLECAWRNGLSDRVGFFSQAIMTGKEDETLLKLAYLDNVSDMALIVLAKKCSGKYNHLFFLKTHPYLFVEKKNNSKSFFIGNITKHMKGLLRTVDLSACRLITDRGLKYMQPLIRISTEVSYICVKQMYFFLI